MEMEIVNDDSDADAIIVNTCGFVEDAKAESIEAIFEAAALKGGEGGPKKVFVTGCLGQRYSDQLIEEIPEVDMVVGFENYGTLPSNIASALGHTLPKDFQVSMVPGAADPVLDDPVDRPVERVQVGSSTVPFREEYARHRLTPQHTAYIRVAEGCDHKCTFCAIPGFRGKFRSKPWAALLEEVRHLAADGVREFNLIAEDTNQYGMDRKDDKDLAKLLREMGTIDGVEWIRILYAYPSYFSDDLIKAIAEVPQVCKYIDIPLQHISNMVLLSMNRPPRGSTEKLLHKLRDNIPGLVLRTTFISGFPGEGEAEHKELVDFCKSFQFERMGVFAYSEEDGTPAAGYENQIDMEIRQARRDELMSLQQDIGIAFAESLVGKELDVLIDVEDEENGVLIGRTQYDGPDVDPHVFVQLPEDPDISPAQVGEIRRCRVTSNFLFDLEAYPIA
ncbi:hypothetical protein CYMTET_11563 [Cymbomonas tetramitiformis]|uniref:Uncharacterized protein n=1 Tax=Cymbomonas tetramitiformis TaxID=36881 RepID=A0AAE0GLU8_9CHLO|nr:hypothetical protein CYMTET_11563 [Cymbomonas tetramitiformis]